MGGDGVRGEAVEILRRRIEIRIACQELARSPLTNISSVLKSPALCLVKQTLVRAPIEIVQPDAAADDWMFILVSLKNNRGVLRNPAR